AYFFFFQAEDGIRDRNVTGVQTCALPIYWDLRGGVDEYLGKVAFEGQRVLEIGPASGFLTFEMEKRGADVVSVEVTEEHGWDFEIGRAAWRERGWVVVVCG